MNRSAEGHGSTSGPEQRTQFHQLSNHLIQRVQIKAAKPSRKYFFGLHPANPLQNSFTEDRGKFSNFVSVPSPFHIGESELEPLQPSQTQTAAYKQSLVKQVQKKQTRNLLKAWARFDGVKKEADIDDLNSQLEAQIRDQLEREELKVQRMLKDHKTAHIVPAVSSKTHRLHLLDNIEKLEYQVRDAQKRAAWRAERAELQKKWATEEVPKQVAAAIAPMAQFAAQIGPSPVERAAYLKSRFRQVFAKVYRLHRFHISLDEVKRGRVFPKTPLSSKDARAFLMAAKAGQAEVVRGLLLKDRHLVHQYDSVGGPDPARPDGAALGGEERPVRSQPGAARVRG